MDFFSDILDDLSVFHLNQSFCAGNGAELVASRFLGQKGAPAAGA
jgi:hypothetical protein